MVMTDDPLMTGEAADADAIDLDDDVADSIDQAIGNLTDDFILWVRDSLDDILNALETEDEEPGDRLAAARQFYTMMHDIKGQAGTFGFALLAEIGESLCSYLRDVRNPPTEGQVGVLKLHATAARFIVERNLKGTDGRICEQFRARRDAMIEQVGRPAA